MAIEDNEIININTKIGNAILVSEDDYNSLIETLYLSSDVNYKKNFNGREKYFSRGLSMWGRGKLVLFKIKYTKQAVKDIKNLNLSKLDKKYRNC